MPPALPAWGSLAPHRLPRKAAWRAAVHLPSMLLLRRVSVGVPAAAAAAAKAALKRGAQAGVRLGGQALLREALRRETLRLPARQRRLQVPGPARRTSC